MTAPALNIRRMVVVFGVAFYGLCFAAEVPRRECEELLATLDSTTARYGRLLNHLAIEIIGVTVGELEAIRDSPEPIAPKLSLEGTQDLVYGDSFRSILHEGGLDWGRLREIAQTILELKTKGVARTKEASKKAESIFHPFLLKESTIPMAVVLTEAKTFRIRDGEIGFALHSYASGWHLSDGTSTHEVGSHAKFSQSPDGTTFVLPDGSGSDAVAVILGKPNQLVKIGAYGPSSPAAFYKGGVPTFIFGLHDFLWTTSSKAKPTKLHGSPLPFSELVTSADWKSVYQVGSDGRGNFKIFDALWGRELFSASSKEGNSWETWFDKNGDLFVSVGAGVFHSGVADLAKGTFEKLSPNQFNQKVPHPFIETTDGRLYVVEMNDDEVILMGLRGTPTLKLRNPAGSGRRAFKFFARNISGNRPVVLGIGGSELHLFDFDRMEVETIAAPKTFAAITVSSGNDGRLIGFFPARNDKLQEIQLYGPVK